MSRFIIWLVTLAGLLPVGFLSIWSLRSHWLFTHMQRLAPDPSSLSLIGSADIEIGPSITKISLSTEALPAVVTVFGIVFVLVGAFFLLPGKPQQFYRNGLSRIGYYVERVIESQNDYASVIIAKHDGAHAVLIARQGRKVSLSVISDLSIGDASDFRSKIGDFFFKRGIMLSNELSSSSRVIKDKTLHFEFALSVDTKANTELIRALFTDLFGVDDSTALEFTATGI